MQHAHYSEAQPRRVVRGPFLQGARGWRQALVLVSVCPKAAREVDSESLKTEALNFRYGVLVPPLTSACFFPPFFKLWEKWFLRGDDLPRITQMAFWQILRIFQLLMMWNFYFKVILDIKLVISDSKKILAKSCTNDDLQYLILTIVRKKKKTSSKTITSLDLGKC